MPFYGSIVVIKRNGADGSTFPLINEVRQIQKCILLDIDFFFKAKAIMSY